MNSIQEVLYLHCATNNDLFILECYRSSTLRTRILKDSDIVLMGDDKEKNDCKYN